MHTAPTWLFQVHEIRIPTARAAPIETDKTSRSPRRHRHLPFTREIELPNSATKAELRRIARNTRHDLNRIDPGAAHRAAAMFLDKVPLSGGRKVACYWPVKDELDCRPLMRQLARRNVQLLLPVTPPQPDRLLFRRWAFGDPLVPAVFGLSEPPDSAPADRPDIIVTPLLAFDRTGARLGYGGGYYDRTITALKAEGHVLTVGFAYAGQEMPGLLAEDNDHPLDMIVTEKEVLRARAPDK